MNKPIKKRPAIFIVNLQWTPKDDVAVLKINGKCDNVMKLVMEYLDLETPNYNRVLDPIFAHTSYLCPKELHTTTQPMLIRATPVHKKSVESEDSDDDCPLNVLKMKMSPNDIEKPVDLSVNANSVITEGCESKFSMDQQMDRCKPIEQEMSLKSDMFKGSSLVCDNNIKSHFEDSVSVNSSEFLKSDRYDTGPMDIECNKFINNNCKYNNNLEELSVEDNIENFEKVHIEMKTSDSEICNVCILLVKNSKNGNSYNKYSHLNSNGITSIPNFNKRTNPILDIDIKHDNAQDNDNSNNVQNNNILSKVSFPTIPSDFNVSQRDENYSSIVRPDFEKYNFKNIHKFKDLNGVWVDNNTFRREKSISNVPYPLVNKSKSDEASSLTGVSEPLDFSLHSKLQMPFETKVFQIYNPHASTQTFPKPATASSHNESTKCDIAIDLSFSKSAPVKTDSDMGNGFSKNIRSPSETWESSFKRCEHFAKLIIQNTILVSRKELKYAYSGLHSIINPIPFYTEYDFTNIFNAFNFIKFAQKLLSKEKNMNINRGRGPIFKNALIKKRKFDFKRIKPQRKEPVCKFCFEHYKSYVCNFYASFNSEERFEKWHKGKLIMCDCCGDTDTSDSETESSDDSSDSVQRVHSDVISLSEVNDNNLLNNDLKNCVQISVNTDKIQGESVQAGWFGKGFRKSRRRKR